MTREEELIAAGWEKRTTYDEPRLSEIAETYRELGFDVHLEPLDKGSGEAGCSDCLMADPDRYRTLWTRPKNASRA